jgi:AraC-like DNA-binding protein
MPRLPVEQPICEPVQLPPGALVRALHVRQGGEAVRSQPFVHFHDVHELVLFVRAAGHFETSERCFELAPRCIAYVPSMCEHNFILCGGRREWVLVQFEAHAGAALAGRPGLQRLRRPFCVRAEAPRFGHLMHLAAWLCELDPADPLAHPLLETLLRASVGAEEIAGEPRLGAVLALERLRPAVERLRQDPARAPSAQRAAALCALSPAYFSRRFKQQFAMSWSEYVRTHRLHLASRLLLESALPIARIAADLGFATPSHFGEQFRHRFGLSPRTYRRCGASHSGGGPRTEAKPQ